MATGRNKISSAEFLQRGLRHVQEHRNVFYAKTDLEVDLAALQRRKQELADSLDPDVVAAVLCETVFAVEFLPGVGTFHALFLVKTTRGHYYLKLATEGFTLAFHREEWAMERLSELGLPSLRNAGLSSHADRIPAPYLFLEEAPGKPLNRFENPDTQEMPEPLLFEFGRAMARYHQLEGAGAGPITVNENAFTGLLPTWSDYVRLRLDEHLRTCLQIQAISGMELSAIESHFIEADDLLGSAPLRLLHGDPGHHNVFSDGKKITAIIDWEDALCGDPIFDVGYWGTFVRDAMRERFLDGYSSVSRLPADFERRYWLYYLRVAISKTVHRFKFGAKDRPGRPPASQRIQKALSKLADL